MRVYHLEVLGEEDEGESEAFRFYSDDGESTSERLSQRSEGD